MSKHCFVWSHREGRVLGGKLWKSFRSKLKTHLGFAFKNQNTFFCLAVLWFPNRFSTWTLNTLVCERSIEAHFQLFTIHSWTWISRWHHFLLAHWEQFNNFDWVDQPNINRNKPNQLFGIMDRLNWLKYLQSVDMFLLFCEYRHVLQKVNSSASANLLKYQMLHFKKIKGIAVI